MSCNHKQQIMFHIDSRDGSKTATVFVEQSSVDSETLKQIRAITSHPSVDNVRIMPDCHKGNGCCVGFTSKLTRNIIPGLIGGDIGCGIAVYPLPSHLFGKKHSLERIDRIIQNSIPLGNGWDRVHGAAVIAAEQYEAFYADSQEEAARFCDMYEAKFGVSMREFMPTYTTEWVQNDLCRRVNSNFAFDQCAMGTLGGGNHYIEIDEADTGGDDGGPTYYLTVHTGSRHIGQQIAKYHSRIMKQGPTSVSPDDADDADVFVDHEESKEDVNLDASMEGLSGREAAVYFFDMIWAQTWAKMNRRCILSIILHEVGGIAFESSKIIESVHNFIDFRDMVIRKGAISAHENEMCVVSLNMRDGILLCRGLGNAEWNCSGPHGCGRIVSRKACGGGGGSSSKKRDAQKQIAAAMAKFEAEMVGVHSTCIVPQTLDERPSAYKDMNLITESIGDSLVIEVHARTVLNVKGH